MKSISNTAPVTRTLDQLVSLLASDTLSIAILRRELIVKEVPKALPIVIDVKCYRSSLN